MCSESTLWWIPTLRFQILYVLWVLTHDRRRVLHLAVTAHPTTESTTGLVCEDFPWEYAPCSLSHDSVSIFGRGFIEQVQTMGVKQVLSAPRPPWQSAYIERGLGKILSCGRKGAQQSRTGGGSDL